MALMMSLNDGEIPPLFAFFLLLFFRLVFLFLQLV